MDLESIINELNDKDIVGRLLRNKREWDTQTIYGDLNDYMKDMYELSSHDNQVVIERLLGKYVIRNIYNVKL